MDSVLPSVFEYVDYRAYLSDWIDAKKAANPSYSHRVFARKAGYANPSLLGQIARGTRNLTDTRLPGFLKALGLSKAERDYFRNLVDLDRATSLDERTQLVEKLAARRRFQGARTLQDDGFRYLSHWYYPAIRELAGRPDFQLDAAWVAARLKPRITVATAREALEVLTDLGLIEPRADGGAEQTDRDVVTEHEVASLAVRNYHRGMAELAVVALEEPGGPERHFGAVTALAPASMLPRLKQEIADFQERILNLCEGGGSGDVVLQLNIQLFPLSVPEGDR